MAAFDTGPAPKLRLLKRCIQKKDSTDTYDCARELPNRPRVRSTSLKRPGWNSDLDVSGVAEAEPVRNKAPASHRSATPPQQSAPTSSRRQRPSPEGNSDAEVLGMAEVKTVLDKPPRPLPPRQHPAPVPAASRRQRPLPEWNDDTSTPSTPAEGTSTPQARTLQQEVPVAKAAPRGKAMPRSRAMNLQDDASLIDSVPIKWPPSCHHAAELLDSVGCTTIGDFRRFIQNAPFEKIVDAMLTADAACASPGGIRDRKDAQKCIEEFTSLVRQDCPKPTCPSVQVQNAAPRIAAAAPIGVGGGPAAHAAAPSGMDVTSLQTGYAAADHGKPLTDSSFGGTGCPRCGRDFTGRALVMHLKTCRPSSLQAKSVSESFSPAEETRCPASSSSSAPPMSPPPPATSVKQAGGFSPQNEFGESAGMDAEAGMDEPQLPCPHCGRSFREKVLQRHVGNCVKINKERKKFNALAHAVPVEARKEKRQAEKLEVKKPTKAINDDIRPVCGMPAWKMKSEAFRNAMKDARNVGECVKQGKPLSKLPPPAPTPAELDDRIQCKTCGRRFGQQQAERHIPLCAKSKGRGKGKR